MTGYCGNNHTIKIQFVTHSHSMSMKSDASSRRRKNFVFIYAYPHKPVNQSQLTLSARIQSLNALIHWIINGRYVFLIPCVLFLIPGLASASVTNTNASAASVQKTSLVDMSS